MSSSSDDDAFSEVWGGRDNRFPRRRALLVISLAGLVLATISVLSGVGGGDSDSEVGEFFSKNLLELSNIYDTWPEGIAPPPLPRCRCQGWKGEIDAYQGGASEEDKELCMSPWGGRYTPCFPLERNRACRSGAMKCSMETKATEDPEIPVQNVPQFIMPGLLSIGTTSETEAARLDSPCLCVFDVDRTLTAKQNAGPQCLGTRSVPGALDNAYGRGILTLSAVAASGLRSSSCSKCYLGIVSHGSAGDAREKHAIVEQVLNTEPFVELAKLYPGTNAWNYGIHIPARSPIAVGVPDRKKQWAVEGILHWYWTKNVTISRERVWFFDDRADNVASFEGTGFNSRQISCRSRDWHVEGGRVGFCGATGDEFELTPGNFDCSHSSPEDATKVVPARGHDFGAIIGI